MLQLAAPHTRLHSGAPWWLVRDGLPAESAPSRTRCDVAIVGAGITGALVADTLTAEGLDVMLIDRRLPGTGSTAVSTALLQYELDVELVDLIAMIGEADAVRAYRLSAATLSSIEALTNSFAGRCGFARRTSLYVASRRSHTRRLQAEAEVRSRAGLDVGFWSGPEVESRFGFRNHGALRTDVAAVVDPLQLTAALLERARGGGASVAPWTTALSVELDGTELLLRTDRGPVRADRVVLACGYEVPPCLEPSVMSLHCTYAMITDPVEHPGPLGAEYILWESARPYTYLRMVDDRVVIGGMDIAHVDDLTRDRLLPGRTRRLERELRRLKPGFDTPTAYSWAGTFGVTRDGLPIVGPLPGIERVYFALGYGGNGITFGALAAELLRDLCLDRENDDVRIFRPGR